MALADHVYVERGLYSHHGIDCGDGWVIHYTGTPSPLAKRDAIIRRDKIEDFQNGGELLIKYYEHSLSKEETMERGLSQFVSGGDGYDVSVEKSVTNLPPNVLA